MYVCICNAITDTQIRTAVSSGARTMRDLRQQLGVCSACGKCGNCARQVLRGALSDAQHCTAGPLNLAVA